MSHLGANYTWRLTDCVGGGSQATLKPAAAISEALRSTSSHQLLLLADSQLNACRRQCSTR